MAEAGIRWRPPELKPQRLVQCPVMADGKALQVPQALAANQDTKHCYQEQKSWKEVHPSPHPSIRDRLQEDDQVGRGIGRRWFWQRRDPFPPAKANGRSAPKRSCDALSISPALIPEIVRRGILDLLEAEV